MPVLLIRHGQSTANVANVIVSHREDPPLTEKGQDEARLLARAWHDHPFAAIYSSPLLRTRQTAEAFVSRGLQVMVDNRLHEIGLGRWDGLTIDQIEADDGERYHQWKRNPELAPPEGGESLSAVHQRMMDFLNEVASRHGQELVLAVSHSDCLKAVMLGVLHTDWSSAQWYHLGNISGMYLELREGHWNLIAHPIIPD